MNTGFSTQQITQMLGLSAARVRAYVKAGLLCPQRGDDGELRFSFQDLRLMRTAEGLVTERLPPRRVRAALRKLRLRLPSERSLTGMNLGIDGGHVVVRDGGTAWRADSGQGLFSFGGPENGMAASSPGGGDTTPLDQGRRRRSASPTSSPASPATANSPALADGATTADAADMEREPTAEDFYQLGCNLEEEAPEAARVAYLNVLKLEPNHADAHVNLGRLMHEAGDLDFAEEHYRAALAIRPADATAYFNLGVVLEDGGRSEAAVENYEAALRADPTHADAHFNAARLHDLAGRYESALRHLHAYRNLTSR
ncbi:MAG: tetratricopeptide repeat protein [Myxococcales bacterium]